MPCWPTSSSCTNTIGRAPSGSSTPALELNPSGADAYDHYGRLLSALERHDEAIAMMKRAQELDPLAHPLDIGTVLLRAGRYDEAVRAIRPAIELDPHYARARATLRWAYLMNGMREEGLTELEKAVAVVPIHEPALAPAVRRAAEKDEPGRTGPSGRAR